jgi:hypothetical protein
MEGAVDPCLAVDGRGCEGGLIYSGDRAARLGLLAIMPMTDLRGGDSVIMERSFFLVNKPLLHFGRNSIVSGEARVLGKTAESVTSNPSCVMDPGTGRKGPT